MQEFDVSINYELCTICEDCIDACDEGVFEFDSDEQQVIVKNVVNCNGCKNCTEICIVSAIYVGESIEKRKDEIEKRKELRQKRNFIFNQLIEKATPDQYGDYRLPLKDVIELMEFKHEEQLEEWFLSRDEYIGYVEDDEVVITSTEIHN
ncbi:MAG: hypothetical protein FK733_09425 [Asgard group archaeon]|nr:hypothetical protein [Asgard group archaeon]